MLHKWPETYKTGAHIAEFRAKKSAVKNRALKTSLGGGGGALTGLIQKGGQANQRVIIF